MATSSPPASPNTTTASPETTFRNNTAGSGARASKGAARDAVDAQHQRFGGIKWGAAFFGWLSANGLAVLLIASSPPPAARTGRTQAAPPAGGPPPNPAATGPGGGIRWPAALFPPP